MKKAPVDMEENGPSITPFSPLYLLLSLLTQFGSAKIPPKIPPKEKRVDLRWM